jgi:hypothetical protein
VRTHSKLRCSKGRKWTVRLAPAATVTRSNCTCARDPGPQKLTLAPGRIFGKSELYTKCILGARKQRLGVRIGRREPHQGPQRHRVVLGGHRPHRLADRVIDHHDFVPHPGACAQRSAVRYWGNSHQHLAFKGGWTSLLRRACVLDVARNRQWPGERTCSRAAQVEAGVAQALTKLEERPPRVVPARPTGKIVISFSSSPDDRG